MAVTHGEICEIMFSVRHFHLKLINLLREISKKNNKRCSKRIYFESCIVSVETAMDFQSKISYDNVYFTFPTSKQIL